MSRRMTVKRHAQGEGSLSAGPCPPYQPLRLIYEQLPDQGIVHAVLDGRRDMQTLLTQRLVMADP
jgi:hypothetical protein